MEQQPMVVAVAVREHLARLFNELDLSTTVPREALDTALADLELGLGQVLGEVERAHRKDLPLAEAVHAHETYPYLARLHGWLHDMLIVELPEEAAAILRRFKRRPRSSLPRSLSDQLCTVARAAEASSAERALARLVMFELVRFGLAIAAYETDGAFEGVGGSRRHLDDVASEKVERLLQAPDALEAAADYRPLAVTMAAAMVELTDRVEAMRVVQSVTQELCDATHARAALELLLRDADPVDATILRHRFDRDQDHQEIPVARLPLEHPLALAGQTPDSIYQRSSRAQRTMKQDPEDLRVASKPLTLIALLLEEDDADAS